MIRTENYSQTVDFYSNLSVKNQNEKIKRDMDVKDVQKNQTAVKSSESKLSGKAKEYLEKLRAENGDFDFIVADKGDDYQALLKGSNKEFSIVFSSAELEKMAVNEKYANEKIKSAQGAVDMSIRICEEYGFKRNFGENISDGTFVNKIAVSVDDDGKMSIYAQLEKLSEKQSDRIEKLREKLANDKKLAAKKAEEALKEKEDKKLKKDEEKALKEVIDMIEGNTKKDDMSIKRTMIVAGSEEELAELINNFDWSKVSEEQSKSGTRIDFLA